MDVNSAAGIHLSMLILHLYTTLGKLGDTLYPFTEILKHPHQAAVGYI